MPSGVDTGPDFYVERLTLRGWFLRVLPSLLREGAGASPRRCWVVDGSRPALRLARLLGRWAGWHVKRLAFRMIDVRDESGLLIRLRVAFRDLAEVQTDVVSEPLFQRALRDAAESPRLPTFLAKSAAAISITDRGTLWRALYLAQVCAWHCRGRPRGARLFLERRPWMASLQRYGRRFGIEITSLPPSWTPRALAERLLGPRGRELARRFLAPPRGSADGGRWGGGPRLAVEYYGHLNLDRPELQSDLFFQQRSSLPAKDMLVLFGVPADPLTHERCAELGRHGMKALALAPGAARGSRVPVFSGTSGGRSRVSGRRLDVAGNSPESRWLRERHEDYSRRRAYWSDLFRSTGTRVYVTWYKNDAAHCAIADALEESGGISAVYQRSFDALPSAELTVDVDIHFSYSKHGEELCRRDGSRVRCHVVTGFLGDHRFELARAGAGRVRRALAERGAERVVALFDENSTDDPRWHTGHELQRDNYRLLLEKVLSEPWLGLVVKPKIPSTLRRRLGPLVDLLDRALATGRCHVFEHGPLISSHCPAEAALAADVAVHGHLCGGTAAVESALAGRPTLLVDREGWRVSPLYRLGVGRVVFKDFDSVWSALREHWSVPGGVPGLGDWTPILDELDPFRDGRAAERMGTFLDWVLEAFREGRDRGAAVARAAERYARLWGADKVSSIEGRAWLPPEPSARVPA